MAVATMDPRLLQAANGRAERIRDKIDRHQKATAAIICSCGIFLPLREIRPWA